MPRLIQRLTAGNPVDAEAAVTHERHRISRELHDGIAQCFLAIVFHSRPPAGHAIHTDASHDVLAKIQLLAKEGLAEARTLALSMHSPVIGAEGLAGALDLLSYKMSITGGIDCSFADQSGGVTLRVDVSHCLYRFAQEAIQNAARHAHATRVDMTLSYRDGAVTLEVKDDGCGIAGSGDRSTWCAPPSLSARMSTVGGAVRLLPCGRGTRVTASVLYTAAPTP